LVQVQQALWSLAPRLDGSFRDPADELEQGGEELELIIYATANDSERDAATAALRHTDAAIHKVLNGA
jgi:hypothetical protein